ncbi:MAG: type II secretion system protein GspE, partial [Deltaproteobacteria bacterium]|nr:type II secretion system protein GspE [Deltaproteobacteria bacterium]
MKLIGEILLETCGLPDDSLSEGLAIQEEKGGRIGEILIRQKRISEVDLLEALGAQFGLKFLSDLPISELKIDFTDKVPIQFLKQYRMVPVFTRDNSFIAINDPLLFQPLDDLRLLL